KKPDAWVNSAFTRVWRRAMPARDDGSNLKCGGGGVATRKTRAIRLPAIAEDRLTPAQLALVDSIRSGPRGQFKMSGPFYCYLHAPAFGELAQKLGAHCRFGTKVPPRLSEFAILVTAQHWKSHYEWAAHAPIAERQGVKPATIPDLRVGRAPKTAPKDERAIHAFIREIYRDKRVSNPTYQ